MSVHSITFKNRGVALLAGLLILGAGAALLIVGIALLAAVAVAGGVLGLGILAYRKLRGRPTLAETMRSSALDPSLEVFPDGQTPADTLDPTTPNDAQPRLPGP